MDREGDGVVVGMAALVGVGQHDIGVPHDRREPAGDLGETVCGALVGHTESVVSRRGNAGEIEGRARLAPASPRIVGGAVEAVSPRVVTAARRAVGDMHHVDIVESAQQGAAAQHLVVGVGHHDEPAPRRREQAHSVGSRGAARPSPYLPQRRASGCSSSAISSRPARVAGCSGSKGWRTASLPITPPAIMTALAARSPHCRFS